MGHGNYTLLTIYKNNVMYQMNFFMQKILKKHYFLYLMTGMEITVLSILKNVEQS